MPARKPAPAARAPGSSLARYEAKRDFGRTPEPPPSAPAGGAGPAGPLTFVVQQHRATRMHWDLRLELDGAMPSWPLPKGPSANPSDRRLAIRTEDHPLAYASFEGVIPKGEYGAGEVIVWDRGDYSPDEDGRTSFGDRAEAEARVRAGVAAGKLSITFRGRKLKGSWALVRTQAAGDSWLLIKHRDEAADPARDLTAEDASVISGLTIADLRGGRLPDPARAATPPRLADLPAAAPGALPARVEPMLASPAAEAFSDPAWRFEPKLDGVRAIATIAGGEASLRARSGIDITAQYPALARALGRQPVAEAVLDGEIVALDERGAPSFARLQQRLNLQHPEQIAAADAGLPVLFFAFDLLHLDGYDLRRAALEHRAEALARALLPGPLAQPVQSFAADGLAAYEAVSRLGLEGIVAKRRDGAYEEGRRSRGWLKIKARRRGAYLVGGYHRGEGARSGSFGALLLGERGEDGALRYRGRVGSGFGEADLRGLRERLDALAQAANPFAAVPPGAARVTFVRPELAAEVEYARESDDGHLREPVFVRLLDAGDAAAPEAAETGGERRTRRRRADAAPPPARGGSAAPGGDAIAEVVEQLGGDAPEATIAVGGHELRVSNLDKELWPAHAGAPAVAKRDLLRYLAGVSPWLLPHMRDRPVTLARHPDGIGGPSFYQKHYDRPPPFVETAEVWVDSAGGDGTALFCNNLPTLLWLGQLANLELHVSLARAGAEPDGGHLPMAFSGSKRQVERSALGHPDFVLFDLDPYIYAGDEAPGEEPRPNPRAFARTIEVARWLKELLDAASLSSFVKTSGATGLHVYVPILRQFGYAAVRSVAGTFADFLRRAHPREVTLEWATAHRTGRVFVDVHQNARTRNLAAAFSPRTRPGAPVSMPLRWDELDGADPAAFTIHTALDRLARGGDPWSGVLAHKHDLRALVERR